jgi:hypothetical protein
MLEPTGKPCAVPCVRSTRTRRGARGPDPWRHISAWGLSCIPHVMFWGLVLSPKHMCARMQARKQRLPSLALKRCVRFAPVDCGPVDGAEYRRRRLRDQEGRHAFWRVFRVYSVYLWSGAWWNMSTFGGAAADASTGAAERAPRSSVDGRNVRAVDGRNVATAPNMLGWL